MDQKAQIPLQVHEFESLRTLKFKNDQDQDHWIQNQAQSPWIQLEVKIR